MSDDIHYEIPFNDEGEIDQNPHNLKSYLQNSQVKAHRADEGVAWELWEEMEYIKCAEDIDYFARNYVKIIHVDKGLIPYNPYPYQSKMYKMLDESRFGIVLAPRQSGKSVAFVIWLLHYAIFQPSKTVVIGAQNLGTAMEMLERITIALENLPFFLQPGTRVLNKTSVVFSNNSKIYARATGPNTLRGLSVNVLFLDEFAIVEHSEKFYTGAYPVISSGKDTKMIITSTANGIGNQFYDLWEKAIKGQNDFGHFEVKWNDVPGRDEQWKKETIARTSERQFMQEFENRFLGGSNTLINADTLLSLSPMEPIFTAGDDNNIRVFEEPKKNHEYVMTVDVSQGVGGDSSAFSIIDVTQTPFQQVVAYSNNQITPYLLSELLVKYAKMYNRAYMCIENNDHGSVVNHSVMNDLEYDNIYTESWVKLNKIGLRQTKKTKSLGCTNFKDLLEGRKLRINDNETIREIGKFEERHGSFQAAPGCHDDLVMGLVIFGYISSTDKFKSAFNTNLKNILYSADEIERVQESQLPPFGIIDKGEDNDPTETVFEVSEHKRFVRDDVFGVVMEDNTPEEVGSNFLF